MKRLPPAKRNQLLIVIVATVALIGLVYSLLISPQKTKNIRLANDTKAAKIKLGQYRQTINLANDTAVKLTAMTMQLSQAEKDVATGDIYLWLNDTFRGFKTAYQVDIPNISQPTAPSKVDLITDFPYDQVKVTLNGVAHYHDLGKFVADFENNFPHMRVINLMAEPAAAPPGSAPERLTFHLDVIALIRPNN
jgi:Tfp pilus assembly protein PilO